MILSNVAAAACLGLVAEAFILPSTLTLPDFGSPDAGQDDFSALRMPDDFVERLESLHIGVNRLGDGVESDEKGQETTRVELRCNDCAVPAASMASEFLDAPELNHLQLDFAIEGQALMLNGNQLYPLGPRLGGPEVDLVKEDMEDFYYRATLDYAAKVAVMGAADGTEAKLIDIFFQVVGFDKMPVRVDGISIRMLEDENSKLRLVHVVESPTDGSPQNGFTHDNEISHESPKDDAPCTSTSGLAQMICRLRTAIGDKVKAWHLAQPNPEAGRHHYHQPKPCGGRFKGGPDAEANVRPPIVNGGPPKFMSKAEFSQHFEPHQDHRHHEHHHDHHHEHHHGFVHAFASALRGFVLSFLMPVMIGVLAGMSASLLGMVVGTALGWLWVKLVRGGKRGNASARQAAREAAFLEEDEVVVGEKDDLLEHAPAYEAGEGLPAYAEKE